MSDASDSGNRRLVGYVMFGSAAFLGAVAVAIAAGVPMDLSDESRHTMAMIIGSVAALDAALGLYFVLSSGSDH